MRNWRTVGSIIGVVVSFWMVGSQGAADASEGWKTYTHPKVGFSLRYPPTLKAIPGKPEEETMPSQEFEWQFPNGEEGRRRAIVLGFYDAPEGETLQEWLEAETEGKVEAIKIGPDQRLPAFLRISLDTWAYEREVYVPGVKQGVVIAIHLVIQVAKRGTQGGIAAIEAEYAKEIATFTTMVRSFQPKSP
jgi:hypothetical protein